ncbi:tRNA dimethylallyltransferase [Algoriphagus faecimaris]|uniref:tRNA dimethylallyltransferase n=1 Tax=Algoriphagus faecimaris TaxID=686796 RepID=A0A1G6S349_9BACT|nr:tRNA (adenosine(37)-N6)-dimethylallyltransferase MiaA [Algoriphagus faecimaris]SDD10616.1 tRNA dimethylallyltransferase [Algoriphagus faecimaris]
MAKASFLILVVGPTAVGKTDLCINLAKKFDTEILSSDSRQFYREMEIGTAKPTQKELKLVPHHFVNSLSIHEDYDVKMFEKDAITLLEQLFKEKKSVIMTGGSGLFADAVTKGLDDMPEVHKEVRQRVIFDYQEKGLSYLQREVEKLDPEYYEVVDQKNPQRLMRALEVCLGTGKPFSSFRKRKETIRPFQILKIGLDRDREEIYDRIDRRMDQMLESGLIEEAEQLFPFRHLNALQTVGYQELFGYLEGKYDKEEAIRLLKRNSRRYAKRQLTWFRKDSEIRWFHPDSVDAIYAYIESQMA